MRRSFVSDSFYRNIFTEYVQHILASGDRPIEFFVEGTRSRCGKAIQPKLGVLFSYLNLFIIYTAFIIKSPIATLFYNMAHTLLLNSLLFPQNIIFFTNFHHSLKISLPC